MENIKRSILLFTKYFFSLKKNRELYTLFSIFIFGLILRLIFMPFALHADFLSINWRAHLISQHSIFFLPTSQNITHILYAINQKVFSSFLGDFNDIFLHPFGMEGWFFTSSVSDWLNFININYINRVLFFLKVPHLVFDILSLFVLVRYYDNYKYKLYATIFWFLNPVNIYSFYIFSRHDSITLFFIIFSFYLLKKRKNIFAIFVYLLAILIRIQPIIYFPFILIYTISKSKRFKEILTILSLTGFFAVLLYIISRLHQFFSIPLSNVIQEGTADRSNSSIVDVFQSYHSTHILRTKIGETSIFLVSYVFGMFELLIRTFDKKLISFNYLVLLFFSLNAIYFSFNPYSYHYFVWLVPFVIIISYKYPKVLFFYILSVIFWFLKGITNTDIGVFSQNLFLPASPSLINTELFSTYINSNFKTFNSDFFAVLFQSLISSSLLFSIFFIIRKQKK